MLQTFLRVLEVCALFAVCSLGPGFYFVRAKPWQAAEKLAAAFGLSNLLVGATAALIYAFNLPTQSFFAIPVVSTIAIWLSFSELRAVWQDADARGFVAAYAAMAAWFLGGVALIRCYSGGGWSGDWLEQYERCRFFLKHSPIRTLFIDVYPMPARPPLVNLIISNYLGIVGFHFAVFQTVAALLSAGVAFPAWLFAQNFAGARVLPVAVLVAFFAFNPAIVENATYPWAKLTAATLTALGAWFYVTGWRTADSDRVRISVLFLSAAVIAHYSALPYALFVAGHFAVVGSRSFANRPDELGWMARLAVLVIMPWIGWSLYNYGAPITFGGETAVDNGQPAPFFENIGTAAVNMFDAIVPHALRGADLAFLGEKDDWSRWRDEAFLIYQTNTLFLLGCAGAVALFLIVRQRHRASNLLTPGGDRDSTVFWVGFCATPLILAIPERGALDSFGLARVSLLPVVIIGLAILAGVFEGLPVMLKRVLVAGLAIDLAFGVAMQVLIESRLFGADVPGAPGLFPNAPEPTSASASFNFMEKATGHIVFLGDQLREVSGPILSALCIGAFVIFRRLIPLARERTSTHEAPTVTASAEPDVQPPAMAGT